MPFADLREWLETITYFFTGHNSDQLDPMMPPEVRERKGSYEFNRIIIDACRPFDRIKDFPPVAVFGEEWRQKIRKKWGDHLFSPSRS